MTQQIKLAIYLLLYMMNTALFADTPEVEFRKTIASLYDFRPSEVDESTRKRKMQEMDLIWEKAEANPSLYLPLLRGELIRESYGDSFFYYDGSVLLLKLSDSQEDLQIAADAIGRTRLADIDRLNFFQTVHYLSYSGANVWGPIVSLLNTPDWQVFVPQHVLTLGQDYTVLYLLLCTDEARYFERIEERLRTESNPKTIKTMILALAYSVSERSQSIIKSFTERTEDPDLKKFAERFLTLETKSALPKRKIKSSRDHFFKFLDHYLNRNYDTAEVDIEQYSIDAPYLVLRSDYDRIKKLRQLQSRRISDEALEEIGFLTMLLQYSLTDM